MVGFVGGYAPVGAGLTQVTGSGEARDVVCNVRVRQVARARAQRAPRTVLRASLQSSSSPSRREQMREAVITNDAARIAELVADVDVNQHDAATGNSTLLHIAANRGNNAAVTALVDAGADIDAENDNGMTALLFAVCKGHVRTARELLKAGADVRHITTQKADALLYAQEYDQPVMLEFIQAYHEALDRNGTGIFLRWLDDNEPVIAE
ncbi:putative ankyrin repeat protein [Porphyridium purpureum]|uniref:Putative ankyrin repeat protein n=1 Tax=Porphyridium purpureum TaxID=35688 RepID=A0A5J4YV68_PORPP|nr:putative ankyrin repeat protein [Porphyridium purpureum]|eukprot:POR8645..scf209_3